MTNCYAQTQQIFGASSEEMAKLVKTSSIEEVHRLSLILADDVLLPHIPKMVRTSDSWLGGRSILDVIEAEGTAPIYSYLRRLFGYSEG